MSGYKDAVISSILFLQVSVKSCRQELYGCAIGIDRLSYLLFILQKKTVRKIQSSNAILCFPTCGVSGTIHVDFRLKIAFCAQWDVDFTHKARHIFQSDLLQLGGTCV